MVAEKELTDQILKAFYSVHKELGFGFLESVYKNALYLELTENGHKCECEKPIDVYYHDRCVGHFKADMVIDDRVILELKAAEELKLEHEFQLINYLKATGIEVGMLLNFGKSAKFKRKIFTKDPYKYK